MKRFTVAALAALLSVIAGCSSGQDTAIPHVVGTIETSMSAPTTERPDPLSDQNDRWPCFHADGRYGTTILRDVADPRRSVARAEKDEACRRIGFDRSTP